MTKPPRLQPLAPRVHRGGRPLPNTAAGLRSRAWWVLRTMRQVTLDDLLFTLADGTERDAASNLRKYLRRLEQVGVVKRLARRAPGKTTRCQGCIVWRLVRDLGPLAPVWRNAAATLWDPNASALVYATPTQPGPTDQPATSATPS